MVVLSVVGNGEPESDPAERFLKDDVVKAAAELKKHKAAVEKGVEGAGDAFEAYKARQKEFAKVRAEVGAVRSKITRLGV